jgi:hypothetical protein
MPRHGRMQNMESTHQSTAQEADLYTSSTHRGHLSGAGPICPRHLHLTPARSPSVSFRPLPTRRNALAGPPRAARGPKRRRTRSRSPVGGESLSRRTRRRRPEGAASAAASRRRSHTHLAGPASPGSFQCHCPWRKTNASHSRHGRIYALKKGME